MLVYQADIRRLQRVEAKRYEFCRAQVYNLAAQENMRSILSVIMSLV